MDRARAATPAHVTTTAPPFNNGLCPGGLLCEDSAPLLGWRVPQRCERRHTRGPVAACSIEGVPWPHVVEFFRSRYASVEELEMGLRILGRAPGPGLSPPRLQVVRSADRFELVALPGDTPPPNNPK